MRACRRQGFWENGEWGIGKIYLDIKGDLNVHTG